MPLITEELVEQAVAVATPSILALLDIEGATWGPKFLKGGINAPGLEKDYCFEIDAAPNQKWAPDWKKPEFFEHVVSKKVAVCIRERASSSVIVAIKPWLLEKDEFLYAGGAYRDGITAALSGAKGWADEGGGNMIIDAIIALVQLKKDRLIADDKMEIE